MFRKKVQKVIEQETEIILKESKRARNLRSRISNDIQQHKSLMDERRKNFRLIRNK